MPSYTGSVASRSSCAPGVLRVVGALAILAAVFLGHGLQCSAFEHQHDSHGPAIMALQMAAVDAAPGPGTAHPAGPEHGPGHAVAVCFAILLAAVALLLGDRLSLLVSRLSRAVGESRTPVRGALERWRPTAPPMAVLCVSRT